MGKPQTAVVALVALGLVIFVQVLRVTTSHSGMSPFITRSPLNRGQRARALATLSGLADPDAGLFTGTPGLTAAQPHDRDAAGASGEPAAQPVAGGSATVHEVSVVDGAVRPSGAIAAAATELVRAHAAAAASATPAGTAAAAPAAAKPRSSLDACEYHAAPDPRALGPGPHEPPAVPLSDTTTCPGRSPFHTLLTAQGTTYQGWQARIMYYHWRKQRAADGKCTDMTGFTRLCASKDGRADGLEKAIPTIYIRQLPDELIRTHFGFGVLNRPHSLKVLLQTPTLLERVAEDFVFIAETDHVLTRPLPNLATATSPAAFVFGYMHAGSGVDWVVRKYWPEGSYKHVQPVGPSPLLITKKQLATFVDDWLDFSIDLRSNDKAERVIQGWVQEMWGYSIAAAKAGVAHILLRDFQIEPGASAHSLAADFWREFHVFHYTYGIEYRMDGRPQGVNQIGEWSLDKRHYGGSYPPRDLEPPPLGANAAACWLLQAWNEAMAADPDWPDSNAFGTVGWRRECTLPQERVLSHAVGSKLVGSRWTWAGIPGLEFIGPCEVKTPWGTGKWGLNVQSRSCDAECVSNSVFLDFSGAHHTLRFDGPGARGLDGRLARFESKRVGDGEKVQGVRQD